MLAVQVIAELFGLGWRAWNPPTGGGNQRVVCYKPSA
jgi:hypothetical protein